MISPAAVLVTVGDELLLGRTVNTNAAWLGAELSRLGFEVRRHYTVGDKEEEICEVLQALTAADVLIFSGGLGPTSDDLTRESVARHLGRSLELNREILSELEERFRARGFETLPDRNLTQAQVPEGALALRNPRGTAPGLVLETDVGGLVVLLPGVPGEMKGIFREELEPILRERFRDQLAPVFFRTLHTTGISESVLAERVDGALPQELGPVSVAFLPDERGVDIRLTARGVPRREASEWFQRLEEVLDPVLGEFRFESESGDLVESVARTLEESGRTLAVAESCTGGLVAKRITDRPGASSYFLGGVVAYADRVKIRELGIDPEILGAEGAVSEEVALAMARGVAERFGASVGVAITGIAGPAGGSDGKPVGTVWYAVHLSGETVARCQRFSGDRGQIRERSAQAALSLLLKRVEGVEA